MKKVLIAMLSFIMLFTSVCTFARFSDVDKNTIEWAGEAIERLCDMGVINGYEDGSFRPDGNVTRAEFAKMLSLAFDLDSGNAVYDDISGHWANEYINSSAQYMYTAGSDFRPDSHASRADIAYAAADVLKLRADDESLLDKYIDADLVIEPMKANIIAAVQNGIVVGYEDLTLRPDSSVTRAEAAVIVCRAIDIISVPDDEKPIPPPADKPGSDKEHIYTLYPRRDLLLVTAVSNTTDNADGEDAYRLSYLIASTGEEYSSVIPADTQVRGARTNVAQIASGDVLLMDTAFLGEIGYLYVFASFDGVVPVFDTAVSAFGDYSIAYGKVTGVKKGGKSVILTVDNGLTVTDEYISPGLDANLYSPWKKNARWSLDTVGVIDPDEEDTYVFIRYTDGVATEIVISDIVR